MSSRSKTKIRAKGRKTSKDRFKFKGQNYNLHRKFGGEKYTFAVGVGYKRDVPFQEKSLRKRYKKVRVVKNKLGYFFYVRERIKN